MNTINVGQSGRVVRMPSKKLDEVQIAVNSFNAAKAVQFPKVPSSNWYKGFNRHYPSGCSKQESIELLNAENPVKSKGPVKIVVPTAAKKRRLDELRVLKSQCVNKKGLTIIATNKF